MAAETKNLNPVLLIDPGSLYSSSLAKARFYKAVSIINMISIFIFAAYLMSLISVPTNILPAANLIIGIAAPFLGVSFTILNNFSKECRKTAEFYKNILLELKTLRKEDETAIKIYLKKINCPNARDTKQIRLALAHYRVWSNIMDCFLKEIKKIKDIQSNDEKFKYKMLKISHDIYEKEVLRAKLKMAQFHHLINNPSDKKTLTTLGKIFTMSFSRRMASFLQENDYYFIFHDSIQKQRKTTGFSFTQIDQKEIHDISKLIFED